MPIGRRTSTKIQNGDWWNWRETESQRSKWNICFFRMFHRLAMFFVLNFIYFSIRLVCVDLSAIDRDARARSRSPCLLSINRGAPVRTAKKIFIKLTRTFIQVSGCTVRAFVRPLLYVCVVYAQRAHGCCHIVLIFQSVSHSFSSCKCVCVVWCVRCTPQRLIFIIESQASIFLFYNIFFSSLHWTSS